MSEQSTANEFPDDCFDSYGQDAAMPPADYAIFILDPQGHVATWNPGAERIKQYKADEIIGQHFSTFYTQDDIDRGWPAQEIKIALTEGHFEDEGWRVRKDGSKFWANVVITVLRDEAGNFRGFSKITRDLTRRRRADENARRLVEETTARRVAEDSALVIQAQRERLHVTLASIGDAVITTDAEGRITFVNSVAENLTGWKLEEASLRNLDDVFRVVNEETRHPVESPALRALKEGVIVGVANHTMLISKDGTERPIDDSAAPIRDATGSVIGCVLVFRDVTESRRAAQEIRIGEARKSAILESALDCIITMDHEGKVVEFNPAAEQTFGYSRGVVVGRDLADFIIPPSLRERHHQGMAHYFATGEGPVLGKRLELPALRADGTEFPVELAITRIPTDGPPLFTAYLRDISEQKRAEQHRSARLAVTHVLSEAASVEDGASGVLQAVCENLGWDVGFFWTVNEAGTALVCMKSWHRPEVAVQAFETTSCSRTFEKGEGLPGRVWASGKRVWILDVMQDGNFPRLAFAARHDLHSAFGCPIVVGDRTLGVIEFFTKRLREPDNDLLEMMGTVAGSVGQFLERKSAEAALLDAHGQLEDRVAERTAELVRANEFLDALLENVQTGVVACDPAGVLTLFNGVTRALHGLPEEPIPPEQWAERYRLYRPDGETPMAKEDVPLYRALQGERVQDAEMVIAPLGVPPRTVQVSGQAFHDDQGTKLGAVVSMQDITARKHAEVELRQAHEELERRVEERTEQLGRANAALRESEEKLRLLADTIPQLAWMARPDGHIFWYNRRWYEYTGTTPEQMEGWGWQSVHDPDVLPKVVERWNRSITTGEPFDMVFPLKAADGQYHPFLTRVNPLRDETGSILYWFGTNTDITELRQTREALVTSEERLRLALDAGRMGVWDWNIRTGELKWSDSLEPLHGLAPGTFGGTFDHFQQLIHSEDREMVTAAIQQALESSGEFYIEFRNVWSNGGIHWIAGSGKVFPGDDGQPLRMIGIGLDVTQRKRAEQTSRFLADASAALAVLVDFDSTLQKVASLAVPSFADWATVDLAEADGSLRRVSVSHVDPAKVQLAHEVHRRFPPDPGSPQGVWNILRTGKSEIVPEITDELLVQSVNDDDLLGIMRELGLKSYIGVPLKVRGKTLGVITFINAESGHQYDRTDLAVAEDLASRAAIAIENAQLYRELRQDDQRKDEFLATLAHELRNPLAPIRNGLQVLRLAGGGGEMVNEARTMMERQLEQMVRLVDDLLDVSRITRNKLELRKERVTLASILHSAVETSRPLLEQSGHTFSLTLPPTPVYLDADLTRLAQVFSNLLNNSAKYTMPGGRISLTGEVAKGEAVLRVRDNGMGIPSDALPRVFEIFSQVKRNMERAQGGLGIGLSLVRRLVEMHGGMVEARSEGPGLGSEFVVRLPVLKELCQPANVPAADSGTMAGPKRRILVVDDNHDSAISLGMMLDLMGNEIQTANDGLAAVEAAEQFRPDVILLDIGLPKLNGYDVCRRIREQGWSQGIVIVALTGWGQEEDRRRSRDAGFDHHLVKPVEIAALQHLLAET